jgi:Xaa-Pro dipeptidase
LPIRRVVAIEPGFVIPGKGAIGIENIFSVSINGGEKFAGLPDNITFI